MPSRFQPHGEGEFYWNGNVLVCKIYGNVNEEAATRFHRRIQRLVLDGRRPFWCRLEILDRKRDLLTPAASDFLDDNFSFCSDKGCVKVGGLNMNPVMNTLFSALCVKHGVEFEEYDKKQQALDELNTYIESINHQGLA